MSNKLITNILILVIPFSFLCCEQEFIAAPESVAELEFVPIDSFTTWDYRVDSIVYYQYGELLDTTSSYLRERISDIYTDENGDTHFKVSIFKKQNLEDTYVKTDTWTATLNELGYYRIEENLRFLKIVFPIKNELTWIGTQFDQNVDTNVGGTYMQIYKPWQSKYVDRLPSFQVNGNTYSDVVEVQLADSENIINLRYAIEHYAKGVGLIKRQMKILHYQPDPNFQTNLPWEEKAHFGYILNQELLNYF